MPSWDRSSNTSQWSLPNTRTGGVAPAARRERPVLVREQPDERRLPSAVGAQDCRVLTCADGERQAVKDRAPVLDDLGIKQLEDGL